MASFNREYLRNKKRKQRKQKRHYRQGDLSPVVISGIALLLITLYLCLRIYLFHLLPKVWRLMLIGILLPSAGIFMTLSLKHRKKGKALLAIGIVLCILMAIASTTLPYIEEKVERVFSTHIRVDVQDYRIYTFNAEYRAKHLDLPLSAEVSDNLFDYAGRNFLYPQSSSKAQEQAMQQLREYLNGNLFFMMRATLWETLQDFYDGSAECILLSDAVVSMIEETDEYQSFSADTLILKTIRTEVDIDDDISSRISEKAFTVFVAGNDNRSGILSIYGRTDVDILLTVNPETAQALIISIPRDTYLPNPALDYDMDKLTHLGNDGIMNTVHGLNEFYDLDIEHYASVNFATFKRIVDALGGIDINNPYDFQGIQRYFRKGDIHLNGEDALDYVRERHTLAKGDYDRNEHQAIVLKAILQKLTSREMLERAVDLLDTLSGSVATNIDPASISELASKELVLHREWNIVFYHLGGYGTRGETASMPGMELYIVRPYKSQTDFVKQEIMAVLTGEILEQKELPAADKTVWEYN